MTLPLKIGVTVLLGVISGILYHLTGLGARGKEKYPFMPAWAFKRFWRRLICPLIDTASILLWWKPDNLIGWGLLAVSFGLCCGAISTYWDFINGNDNHWLHGFGIGLARLPLIWAGKHWLVIVSRAIVLAVLMGWVSVASKKDWKEEIGRGVAMPLTTPLFYFFK